MFYEMMHDNLGVFHANKISMCLDPHLNFGVRLAHREAGLSPLVKYFADRSKAVHILWIIYVIPVLCLLCFHTRLFIVALWSPVCVTFPYGILGQLGT